MTIRPMPPDEYDQAVAELTAFARAHMALGHPPGMPARECLTCPWIERGRQAVARPVPDVRYWPGLGRWGLVRAFWEGVMWRRPAPVEDAPDYVKCDIAGKSGCEADCFTCPLVL